MFEWLGTLLATLMGTAAGNMATEDALQKRFRVSKKTDDRLNGERASLWYRMYIKRRLHKRKRLDELSLIKFDALVTVFRRGEITYREFSDELDRLEDEQP